MGKIENRLRFGEIIGKRLVSCFFLTQSYLFHARYADDLMLELFVVVVVSAICFMQF